MDSELLRDVLSSLCFPECSEFFILHHLYTSTKKNKQKMPALPRFESIIASSLAQDSSTEKKSSPWLKLIRPLIRRGCTPLEKHFACPSSPDVNSATNKILDLTGSPSPETSCHIVNEYPNLPLGSTPASSEIKILKTPFADVIKIDGISLGVHPRSPGALSDKGDQRVHRKGFGLGSLPSPGALGPSHDCVSPGWLGSGGTLGNGQAFCSPKPARSFSNWLNKPVFPSASVPVDVPPIAPAATTQDSGSDYGRVAIYTVVGFAAIFVFCTAIFGLFRCIRPCRLHRREPTSTDREERRSQINDAGPDLHSIRRARQQERRAQLTSEAAMLLQQDIEAGIYAQHTRFHSSTRSTESSAMWSSAGDPVTRPERAWQTTRSTTESLSPVTTATTPLPKYEREDPLFRSQDSSAELFPLHRSPTYTEA